MIMTLLATAGGLAWLIYPQTQSEVASPEAQAQTQPKGQSASTPPPTPGNMKPAPGSAPGPGPVVATPSPVPAGSGGNSSANMPLPEPIQRAPRQPRAELWQVDTKDPSTEVNGIPATRISIAPQLLDAMHVGQEVTLPIPALNRSVTAKITSTHNQLDNVEVFKGPVTDGHPKDNVIITRGQTSTYVVVATREGTYSATIDNRTGNATLTDEGDITEGIHPGDDSISVPGIEMPTPESS
ncbi:hypothetical protein J057_08521 [Marinobacter nanhaiticus D15-8W]|uniref:Uncharacterized protein n=2 Tax=Marinobacter TaxID=2742 RepID=N6WUY5_9GAMM|nr:hypothetical protein J057_08521 [Marinobacter nanhaiticus D15-8W]